MSTSRPAPDALSLFVRSLKKVPAPRSKQGQSHPFATLLALVLLGLIGNLTTLAEIQRWGELHYPELKTFLRFRRWKSKSKSQKKPKKIPHAISLARVLRKLPLSDLQHAFADFPTPSLRRLHSLPLSMASVPSR